MGGRDAEIRVKLNPRDIAKGAREARAKVKRELGSIGREVGRSIKGAFTGALDIAGIGSIGAIAAAARKVYGFQDSLVRLQISAGKSKGAMRDLEAQLFRVGKATAVDPEQLLAGAQVFTSLTGDLSTFTSGLEDLARVSTATGANMDDLARVAAGLQQNLGIGGADFGKAFDVLAAQGKAGAVELNELSRELAGLTPRFATFGKTGVEGLSELGALLQMVRGGFGTTSEAATGLEALMGALAQKAGDFKKAGVRIFDVKDGKKTLRPLADLIFEIGDSKLMKDPTALIKALGSKEAYTALIQALNQGRKKFDELTDSQRAAGTITRDFNTYMDSTAGKTKSAQAALSEVFNESLKNNLDGIASALKAVARMIGWIGDHPMAAALLLGGARLGPGIVGAGLAVRGALAGGGAAAGGVAGAVGSAATGAAGAGAAGGIAAKGMMILAAKAGAVAAAGAAGVALGRWLDDKTGLSTRLANLARGEGFGTGETEGQREARLVALRDLNMGSRQMGERTRELESLGYRGSLSPEAVNELYSGQGITKLRQAREAARALGVGDPEVKRLGHEELLRQFPLALGPNGMELDTAAAERVRGQTRDDREFRRGRVMGQSPAGPQAPFPVDVRVVVSFDGDKPMAQVLSDSKSHRMR